MALDNCLWKTTVLTFIMGVPLIVAIVISMEASMQEDTKTYYVKMLMIFYSTIKK